jgi:glycosyltransferase involved in cell wall biosynthesis
VAARLTGVKGLVHGEHGTLQIRNHAVQRFVWGRVDRVLSVSSTLAQRMATTFGFPLERISTIRNGVDSERFDPVRREHARGAMGLCADDVVVGLVGRLEAVKDQARLLEAAAVLATQGLSFRLVIAGEGSLRASLEQQALRLGLSDRTTFLGMRPDVENVMPALDIFVLCSTSEGLSNTILEAMASGVATVATDVGGARELLDDGVQGVIIPSKDTAALAGAVSGLVRNRDRRLAMGRAARERVQARFTLETMVRAYEQVYEQVASVRGLGGRSVRQS